jgi:phytoene synthase
MARNAAARGSRRPGYWSVEEAFAYCEGLTRGHYENFPVASLAVPRPLRKHVCAVYAFARSADDFADESIHEGRRLELIDLWESELNRCLLDVSEHPVFVALGETIREFDLPDRYLRDLLDAFRQDCRIRRYQTWADVLDYCRRSANPVGRLVLHLFGHRDERLAALSDSICTALQLTNFWQDVSVDLRKDRIYIPREDRERWEVTEDGLRRGEVDDRFRSLMAELIERTRGCFAEGAPLLREVRGRLAFELRLVWLGGHRILERIEKVKYDVFRRRPMLGTADRIGVAGRALAGRWTTG